jgi:hypothetical protein
MKWFRSNIRLGSRLALFALAIQFLLSFGHFHGGSAQAASASASARQSELHGAVSSAILHLDALHRALHEEASRPVQTKTSSDHEPDGQPADHCAICAVMALANALLVATPPCLPRLQAAAFSYLTRDAGSFCLNCRRVAFEPRAPPIA